MSTEFNIEDFKKEPKDIIKNEIKEIDSMILKLSQSAQKLDSIGQQQEDDILVQLLEDSVKDMQQHRQRLIQTKEILKEAKCDFTSM